MEILTARQKKAEELKRLTDLASQMAEMQLAELRAEIKVSSKRSQPDSWARDLTPIMFVLDPQSAAFWGPNITHPGPFPKAEIENGRVKSPLITIFKYTVVWKDIFIQREVQALFLVHWDWPK